MTGIQPSYVLSKTSNCSLTLRRNQWDTRVVEKIPKAGRSNLIKDFLSKHVNNAAVALRRIANWLHGAEMTTSQYVLDRRAKPELRDEKDWERLSRAGEKRLRRAAKRKEYFIRSLVLMSLNSQTTVDIFHN
jgi:hypothetical protein